MAAGVVGVGGGGGGRGDKGDVMIMTPEFLLLGCHYVHIVCYIVD